jgi:Ala-tRNA(Pro) deacylase
LIPTNIKAHLNANDVVYLHHAHARRFTSPEVADALDMTGKIYAKTLVVMIDGDLVLAAVPANKRLDVEKLARLTGASDARLAHEEEFRGAFPTCEVGAMPPLGDLFDITVWLDESFLHQPTIAFDAGTHTDTVEMGLEDFRRIVRPRVAKLAVAGD